MDDELLWFFERCSSYVEGVEKNRTALQEVEKFKHGEEMEAVRRRVAEKLGLPRHRLTPGLESESSDRVQNKHTHNIAQTLPTNS